MGIKEIRQLLKDDKDEIDSNLSKIAELIGDLNETFSTYSENLGNMESQYLNNKVLDDLEQINSNILEIGEAIENHKVAINVVYSNISDQDGSTK